MTAIKRWLNASQLAAAVDAGSFQVFVRIFFAVVLFGLLRFVAKGWVQELYLEPSYHFAFPNLPKMPVAAPVIIWTLFLGMASAAFMVICNLSYRISLIIFLLIFCYFELLDAAYYLNHYFLIILVAIQLTLLATPYQNHTPLLTYWILRLQFCIVYWGAAVAKMQSDWLLRAEPMQTWLQFYLKLDSSSLFQLALILSWLVLGFELLLPLLLWQKKYVLRGIALAWLFHLVTAVGLGIGMFPWLMLAGTLIFLPPDFFSAKSTATKNFVIPLQKITARFAIVAFCIALSFHLALLLRPFLLKSDILWSERGLWFSWRVMVMEKTGYVRFLIHRQHSNKNFWHQPWEHLNNWQWRQMAAQPDLILQYAQDLGAEWQQRHAEPVQIFAESYVSLNGRERRQLIKHDVDLMQITKSNPTSDWQHTPAL